MKVLILSGISGSGKSTIAESIVNAIICSADNYFLVDGKYQFNSDKIAQAHNACLRKFSEELIHWTGKGKTSSYAGVYGIPILVVDNTNSTIAEISPYYALSAAYGAEIEIITCWCQPEVAFARNKHQVPLDVIQKQSTNLWNMELPDWWNCKITNIDT